jgi:hypothetical protein
MTTSTGAEALALGETPDDTATALPTQFMAVLNSRWRVTEDELQWILEKRRFGGVWRGRSYCRTKAALLRCIREHVEGDIDLVEFIKVQVLPDWHQDWEAEP